MYGLLTRSESTARPESTNVAQGPLKDKSGFGRINATKEVYNLLTRILPIVSHFELSIGCQVQKCFDNLGHSLSLSRHFCASTHDNEANSD